MLTIKTKPSIASGENVRLDGHYVIIGDVGEKANVKLEGESSLIVCGNIKSGANIRATDKGSFLTVWGNIEGSAIILFDGDITCKKNIDKSAVLRSINGSILQTLPDGSFNSNSSSSSSGGSSHTYVFQGPIVATGNSVTHFGQKFN